MTETEWPPTDQILEFGIQLPNKNRQLIIGALAGLSSEGIKDYHTSAFCFSIFPIVFKQQQVNLALLQV